MSTISQKQGNSKMKQSQTPKHLKHRILAEKEQNLDDSFIKQQQEEIIEVSHQLSNIRKKYDTAKQLTTKRQNDLSRIKYELGNMSKLEKRSENHVQNMRQQLDEMLELLQNTKTKHEESVLLRDQYSYMLSRLKQEKIVQQYKAKRLMEQLDFRKQELFNENQKAKQFKDQKMITKKNLEDTMNSIQQDIQNKDIKLKQLERNIYQKKAQQLDREAQLSKQNEIIKELASKEDMESVESQNRESLIVHKFWYFILKKIIEKEHKKSKNIEIAYQQVKSTTGISDINEIINKFLTREHTYKDLLQEVQVAEQKLDQLKESNAQMRKTLKNLEFTELREQQILTQDQISNLVQQLYEKQKQQIDLKDRIIKAKQSYELAMD